MSSLAVAGDMDIGGSVTLGAAAAPGETPPTLRIHSHLLGDQPLRFAPARDSLFSICLAVPGLADDVFVTIDDASGVLATSGSAAAATTAIIAGPATLVSKTVIAGAQTLIGSAGGGTLLQIGSLLAGSAPLLLGGARAVDEQTLDVLVGDGIGLQGVTVTLPDKSGTLLSTGNMPSSVADATLHGRPVSAL